MLALGFGLANAKEPTLEDALGGLQGVGDEDLTPLPTVSPEPTTSGSATPGPSGKPTKPAAPPGPPVLKPGQDAYGLSVTAVGDSVLLAARDAVLENIPKSKVDAVVSRQSWEVFDRIKERKAAGKLGDVVVIHTGTNGTVNLGDLQDLLTLLKDRSRVILVTPKAQRPWIEQATNAIKIAAKKFEGGNVRVADWQVFGRPPRLVLLGRHPHAARRLSRLRADAPRRDQRLNGPDRQIGSDRVRLEAALEQQRVLRTVARAPARSRAARGDRRRRGRRRAPGRPRATARPSRPPRARPPPGGSVGGSSGPRRGGGVRPRARHARH